MSAGACAGKARIGAPPRSMRGARRRSHMHLLRELSPAAARKGSWQLPRAHASSGCTGAGAIALRSRQSLARSGAVVGGAASSSRVAISGGGATHGRVSSARPMAAGSARQEELAPWQAEERHREGGSLACNGGSCGGAARRGKLGLRRPAHAEEKHAGAGARWRGEVSTEGHGGGAERQLMSRSRGGGTRHEEQRKEMRFTGG